MMTNLDAESLVVDALADLGCLPGPGDKDGSSEVWPQDAPIPKDAVEAILGCFLSPPVARLNWSQYMPEDILGVN